MRRIFRPGPAVLVLAALGPASLVAQTPERYSITGNQVVVYNLAGTVTLVAGGGENVVVEVTRGGSDAAQLKVERREIDGRAGLVVRYPDDDVVYRSGRWNGSTQLQMRSDGTFFGRGDSGDRIRIRSRGDGTEAHADLRILVPASKSVFVRLGVGHVTADGIGGALDIDVASASVQTSRTRGGLRIDTGSGSVRVSDAQGDVLVDTGSGSVELNGVRGDDVNVDTGSGSVTGSDITARVLRVDTGSGTVRLTAVASADIELDTGSGGVELDLTTDVDRLVIDTGSGGVRLAIPSTLGATVDIETGSGGVAADVPLTATRRSRDHLEGRIGDGRGTIEIDTGSGGVRIRQR